MLGQAIGDALGMPVEGLTQSSIQSMHGTIDRFLPLVDRSGNQVEPAGQYSDNTELAMCLSESIVTSNGFVNPETAGYRFIQVLHSPQSHFLGETTRQSLVRAEQSGNFQDGLGGEMNAGASPAARVAPVALVHSLSEFNAEVLVREVMRSCFITHSHPEAVNGALAVAYALRMAVRRELPLEYIIDEVLAFIDEDEVARRMRLARTYIRDMPDGSTDLDVLREIGLSGYIAETVSTALYIIGKYGLDYRRSIQLSAAAGGATSPRGAIVGAIAGCWAGAEQLPQDLVEDLDSKMYFLMAAPTLLKTAQMRAGLFLHLHEI